ncbi:hypothetical protein [Absidia glauca]|uniref:Mid2 domain-containing protein n=1 Tax=Absidia glauca TaxID=4829 RepID=A0A168NUC2_ABSGL|nr:hypothetical protein [Absidia glauca]
MLITYRSLLFAIVVILKLSFCLGHGDTQPTISSTISTANRAQRTHHVNTFSIRPTPTTKIQRYHHKLGHKKTRTVCTTKTLHPKGVLTTHRPRPTTTVHCATKVVWVHNRQSKHTMQPKSHHQKQHSGSGNHKSTSLGKNHRKKVVKATTTSTKTSKPTTTTTTSTRHPTSTSKHKAKKHTTSLPIVSPAGKNVVNPVNAFSDDTPSTASPVPPIDPSEPTPAPEAEDTPSSIDQPSLAAALPPSGSALAAVKAAATPSGSDPNDTYIETQAVKNDGSTNTSLGLGLGLGVGCVAAVGLAGLLVHNRRRGQEQDRTVAESSDQLRWRPQSFMGVVASVVAKLPRSPSQRSQMNTGMAIGSGLGAVELASSQSYHSQPPALASVHPQYQY